MLFGFVFGWVCFGFLWKTPGFLLSPILQYEGIADQRQNVLMTVRALSVHGMSSQKKLQMPKQKKKNRKQRSTQVDEKKQAKNREVLKSK